jgi:hypothetical protein
MDYLVSPADGAACGTRQLWKNDFGHLDYLTRYLRSGVHLKVCVPLANINLDVDWR